MGKEIKAWADGAEIESRFKKSFGRWTDWLIAVPMFHIETDEIEYRIKRQPKEPQYLYVYEDSFYGDVEKDSRASTRIMNKRIKEFEANYIGKIKLEVDDE